MTLQDNFSDTADENRPEPTEKQGADETTNGPVKKNSVRLMTSEVTGRPREDQTREPANKENEFHKRRKAASVAIFRQGPADNRTRNIFFTVSSERRTGR
jgi:hypothetical protein